MAKQEESVELIRAEVVEHALARVDELDRFTPHPLSRETVVSAALDFAYPALRSQIEREVGERLLSEEAVRKALLAFTARAEYPSRALGEREVDMREALQAALTATQGEAD